MTGVGGAKKSNKKKSKERDRKGDTFCHLSKLLLRQIFWTGKNPLLLQYNRTQHIPHRQKYRLAGKLKINPFQTRKRKKCLGKSQETTRYPERRKKERSLNSPSRHRK